jgi:hypothetical protein
MLRRPGRNTDRGLTCQATKCIAVTVSRTGPRYRHHLMQREEVRMVALAKQTKSRLVRWFKGFRERNKPPHKWYEHDHYGI